MLWKLFVSPFAIKQHIYEAERTQPTAKAAYETKNRLDTRPHIHSRCVSASSVQNLRNLPFLVLTQVVRENDVKSEDQVTL